MKAKYVKPDIYYTEFVPNHAVSACDVTSYNKPVTVACLITSSETVYDAGVSGCDFTASSLVYYGGGTISSDRDAKIKFIQDGADGVINGTYNASGWNTQALEPGYYLFWTDGRTPHGGLVPSAVSESIKNHS